MQLSPQNSGTIRMSRIKAQKTASVEIEGEV